MLHNHQLPNSLLLFSLVEREITKAATFVTGLLSGFARKRTVFDMIVT